MSVTALVKNFKICTLRVEDGDLKKVECVFNEVMKLIICRRCELAIAADYIAVHTSKKHGIHCSKELIQSITTRYQPQGLDAIIRFRMRTKELAAPVDGIPMERGYRCRICRHCTHIWGSMTDHFRRKHGGLDVKPWTEDNVEMQLLFGGRLRKWFTIGNPSRRHVRQKNRDSWTIVKGWIAEQSEKATKAVREREDNVRLINGLVAQTRWDILVEGEDQKRLIGIGVSAKDCDPLKGIMKLCQIYFTAISDKLPLGDVLLRRKIMSNGYRVYCPWMARNG